MKYNSVAIITARGGSKRIPRKNIKPFLGVPVIKYVIDAAMGADCFDEVMVSTDDKEIGDIALSYGAEVPFYRSEKAASDFATSADVLGEVISEYKKRGKYFKYCCCIYPTASFITPERLKEGYNLLKSKNASSVVPVCLYSPPIQWSFKIEDDRLKAINKENLNIRSQDLCPTYYDCGQFYWFTAESFLKEEKLFTENTVPLIVPEIESQDIDTEEDWKIAEMKYKILKTLKDG